MATYSIRDLEKICGTKAHTIRIWERRYNLIHPLRTPTNIRLYSDNDLKRLLNISILIKNGCKISKIAQLTDSQLESRVADLCLESRHQDIKIEALIMAMFDFDEKKFMEVVSDSILLNGFEQTIAELMFPLLERIGVLWQTGSIMPAHEHFISNLIRQKVIVAIDNEMWRNKKTGISMVFFLPEGEFHELSLLFYSLIARKQGLSVIYLGASVPLSDLDRIGQLKNADSFFMALHHSLGQESLDELFANLAIVLEDKRVFIGGFSKKMTVKSLANNFTFVNSVDDFITHLH